MKVLASFVFIILLLELQSVAFCDDTAVRGNYEIGKRVKGDSLLKTISAQQPPAAAILGFIPRKVDTTLNILAKEAITFILIEQRDETSFKANRADVKILSGAIGKKNIALKLESQRGYGFNYEVYVYGF